MGEAQVPARPVKVAAVDLGTVTSRLILAEIEGGRIVRFSKRSAITDLGEGVDATGELSQAAIERVADVCSGYAREVAAFAPDACALTLTSAARDAANGNVLLERLRSLGLEPQIIPGETEARLTFFGVAADFAGERIGVVDSGGGSTEIAVGRITADSGASSGCGAGRLELEQVQSLNIGCRRVTDKFFSAQPPAPGEVDAAHAWMDPQFAAYWQELAEHDEGGAGLPDRIVAVGGTVTTLVAIVHGLDPYDSAFVHLHELTLDEVRACIDRFARMTTDEIAALPGIQPKRARVIMAGALAIESVLATGGYRSLTVSENGLLIGLARTVAEAYEQGATTVGWLPKLS